MSIVDLWWEYMNGEIENGRFSAEYVKDRAIENGYLPKDSQNK